MSSIPFIKIGGCREFNSRYKRHTVKKVDKISRIIVFYKQTEVCPTIKGKPQSVYSVNLFNRASNSGDSCSFFAIFNNCSVS